MMITTEISDTVRGRPASQITAELDVLITGHGWREVGHGITNDEGRIFDFGEPAAAGVYRMMFDIESYLPESFFPSIAVAFEVRDPGERCHVRVVLSAFGYAVYRA
jgi:5-hydroxyisourate hydrolase